MTSPRHFSPRLKLLVTSGDDRTDFGEKDGTVHPLQRILDTRDKYLINVALELADRCIAAEADLRHAQTNKLRVVVNGGSALDLFNANERIFGVEEEIERIFSTAELLMTMVETYHMSAAVSRFHGETLVHTAPVIVVIFGPEV